MLAMSEKGILIIDDHAMFRTGLYMLIDSGMSDVRVTEAGSLREGLDGADRAPDVVLLDIQLPGLNGMEGIGILHREWPKTKILMLSSQDDSETVRAALSRGAAGFVSKAESAERIIQLLEQALTGEMVVEPVSEGEPQGVQLTPRQSEVLELLCQGLPNKLIARELDLSENTVRWHVQGILEQLQVSSRAEASFMARKLGLIS